jgi:Na+/proline symporter
MWALGILTIGALCFLALGWFFGKKIKRIEDIFPTSLNGLARVSSSDEFSATTVATSISLATVILAYFSLASYYGLWLFWTVLTSCAGLILMRVFAHRIWRALQEYQEVRPTLHGFLGHSFSSPTLAWVASVCTALGYIGAFAVELIVGATFFAWLFPAISPFWVVIVMASVAMAYTIMGGFRIVVVTDRIQMGAIWVMIGALLIFGVLAFSFKTIDLQKIALVSTISSPPDGLLSFLIGIALINIPSYVADMGTWQRIAASHSETVIQKGMISSTIGMALSWGLLVILALFAPAIAVPVSKGINPLIGVLQAMQSSVFGMTGIILFMLVINGLFAAMLAKASTQLMASGHTICQDILYATRHELFHKLGIKTPRIVLVISGIVSIGLVQGLMALHFDVVDLVFAIFGSQLSLVPPVLISLFTPAIQRKNLGAYAVTAVSLGFLGGWIFAIVGKIVNDSTMVFLSPCVSLGVSSVLLFFPWLLKRASYSEKN